MADPTQIPLDIKIQQPPNLLDYASRAQELQSQMLQNQQRKAALDSQQGVADAYRQSIDDQGNLDTAGLQARIAQDPRTWYGRAEAISTAQAQKTALQTQQKAALENSGKTLGMLQDETTKLLQLGDTVTIDDVKAGFKNLQMLDPKTFNDKVIAGAYADMPEMTGNQAIDGQRIALWAKRHAQEQSGAMDTLNRVYGQLIATPTGGGTVLTRNAASPAPGQPYSTYAGSIGNTNTPAENSTPFSRVDTDPNSPTYNQTITAPRAAAGPMIGGSPGAVSPAVAPGLPGGSTGVAPQGPVPGQPSPLTSGGQPGYNPLTAGGAPPPNPLLGPQGPGPQPQAGPSQAPSPSPSPSAAGGAGSAPSGVPAGTVPASAIPPRQGLTATVNPVRPAVQAPPAPAANASLGVTAMSPGKSALLGKQGTEFAEQLTTDAKAAQNAAAYSVNAKEMRDLLPQLSTDGWFQAREGVARWVEGLYHTIGKTDAEAQAAASKIMNASNDKSGQESSIAQAQAALKLFNQTAISNLVGMIGSGHQVTDYKTEMGIINNPNPRMDADAIKIMMDYQQKIAQIAEAKNNFNAAYQDRVNKYGEGQYPISPSKLQSAWIKKLQSAGIID